MCGIAGIFSGQSLPDVTGEHVAKMLKVIRHRGPDGERMHLDLRKGVAMGHARLSINDLQYGHQPLVSADKKK